MRSEKTYRLTAKAWSFVFVAVALLFLFAPEQLADTLTQLAALLGLSGSISAPPHNLWHVLTFSLMGTLALLAARSAKEPTNPVYYKIIVAAKLISVVGFLWLTAIYGSAWLTCAVADGFVALTLVMTFPKTEQGSIPGFARPTDAPSPFYNVWFGKIDLSPGNAFWFRYTTLNGVKQEASTWAILFEQEKIATGKNTWPLDQLAPPNSVILPNDDLTGRFIDKKQVFHLGKQHLDEANAIGQAGAISWDLSFIDHGKRFEFVPSSVKALGVAKSTYNDCFMDLRFSGEIKTASGTIKVDYRPGMLGHIYGKQTAHEWAWAHCNNFEGAAHVIFESLSARIKLGGKLTPPLTSTVLFVGERCYSFCTFKTLLNTHSVFGNGQWEFKATSKQATLRGKVTSPGKVALVEYTDTDDSNLWCHNSKLSDLELKLTDHQTKTIKWFTAKGTAAFELVNRNRPDRKVDL